MGMKERGKGTTGNKQEKRDQGKGRGTWKNRVCVPHCESALLATI